MRIIRTKAYARAGLIGNPTDGYNGKTISFVIQNFSATVVMYPWDELEILWTAQDKNRFQSLDELVNDVNLNGYYGGVRLVKATIKRFAEYCARQNITLSEQPFSIRYETDIPRGVGLAGSSAIVVATLKALLEYYQVEVPKRVQPSLARSVENDELGIACGYQDRAIQVYGDMLYMDFSDMESIDGYECGVYEPVTPVGVPNLYIAYDRSGAKISDSVHGPLRTRMLENESLGKKMQAIADLVPLARVALEQGDHESLDLLINKNFDLRAELYQINALHHEMVRVARGVGATAKFAGSGGAIVGTYRDEAMYQELEVAMRSANEHWQVLRPKM